MKRLFLPTVLATALAAVAAGCAAPEPSDESRTEVVIAVASIGGGDGGWDPSVGFSTDGYYAAQATMSPLFYWESSGAAIPVLGESYEVSDDRTSVDVVLREGARFHDGSPVDAEAVAAFYDYLLREESAWPLKPAALAVGASFSAVDDRTVRVSFSGVIFHPPYHYWDAVRMLFMAPVLSPAALADPKAAAAEPMSVGPYVIESFQQQIEMTLVRNPDYWDPDSYPFDTVVLKELPDETARLNALISGQVDVAQISGGQVAEAEASGFRIQYGSPTYYALIVRNPENSTLEPLRDIRVRHAMMYAFDRETIAETLDYGYGRVSSQAFVEGQGEYVEGGDDRYGYDPEKARELMAEAGYAEGFDVEIPNYPAQASVEPIIQQSLADIGIRVTFTSSPDVIEWVKGKMGGEYPLNLEQMYNVNTTRLLDEEIGDFGRLFDQNDDIDRLLVAIRTGDAEESAQASKELGEKLLDEAWYIPFSRPGQFYATAEGVAVQTDDIFGGSPWLLGIVRSDQ